MDPVHLHLMLNHVPIIATIFSLLILFYGIYKSERVVINLSLTGFVVAGSFSLIVFLTGSAAEGIIESVEGFSAAIISEHEEAAKTANIISIILAVTALAGFAVQKIKPEFFKTVKWAVVVLGLVSTGFFGYTAYLGGQIHHTEIQISQAAEDDGFIDSCSEGEETLGDEFAQ